MRAVVSRVSTASVTVGGQLVGELARPGLLALVGVGRHDTVDVARQLAGKLHELRILREEQSASTAAAPLLVVSQFTLYGSARRGRRPSWAEAAPAAVAQPLVEELVADLRRRGAEVVTGVFGAEIAVASVNDGPFTVLLEL